MTIVEQLKQRRNKLGLLGAWGRWDTIFKLLEEIELKRAGGTE